MLKSVIEHYINMQQLSFFALAFLTQTDFFFFFYQNVINLTEEKYYKLLWFFKSIVPPSG